MTTPLAKPPDALAREVERAEAEVADAMKALAPIEAQFCAAVERVKRAREQHRVAKRAFRFLLAEQRREKAKVRAEKRQSDKAKRDMQVVAMRNMGATYRAIGDQLGLTAARARQVYKRQKRKERLNAALFDNSPPVND